MLNADTKISGKLNNSLQIPVLRRMFGFKREQVARS